MADALAQLTPHQIALRIRSRPPIRNLIEYVVLSPRRIRCNRRVLFAHLPLAQMIEAKIGHDTVNPSVKRALKAKIPNALVRLQESFLINILGLVFRAGEMQGQPQHCLVETPHQFLEGSAIATLPFADKKSVGATA